MNKERTKVAEVHLVSAYNRIENVMKICFRKKRRYFVARQVLKSAQSNIARALVLMEDK